jgi:uncharacterized protein YukE
MSGATGVSALASFSFDWIGGDIRGLSALAGALYGYVPEINGVTSALDGRVQALVGAAGWTGSAASAFERGYEADAQAAHGLAVLVEDAGEIVDALAVALSRIENDLEQAADKAQQHGAPIEANGSPLQECLAGTTPAGKEAARWLEWYRTYYADCLAAARQVRAKAAADLRDLPVPSVRDGGGSGWEEELVAIGRDVDGLADAGLAGLAGTGAATTRASALMRAGDSQGARVMSLLSRNSTWQELGELGRSGAVDLAGNFLVGTGAVLTGIGVYQKTHNVGEAAVDATGDTAISLGATWAGTQGGIEVGLAAGSTVGPVGTLVGGGVGAIVGAGVGFVTSDGFNDLVSDAFGWL